METVKFTQMKDGDREYYIFLRYHETGFAAATADRLLKAMVDLDESLSGYKISRLDHSLQAATRAWKDVADIDWVVATLLHDIGDIYTPYNHDEYAAAIIRPFVRDQCAWVVQKHADFQLVYYGEHVGANPNKRDAYIAEPYFEDCAEFCERWDQSSFDPDYKTLPLEFFAPMVREGFARKAHNPQVVRKGERVPLTSDTIAASRQSDLLPTAAA
ncbi:HD domain-containing protein [Rhizobium leguminosarum]|uniref:HD domain-containing protein n=1 Tax=Rhizobium leguminosarum TaxID=384 RepID=A0A6P0B0E4_RHILE|nr:HD domain-containing protein [Rhizobium leguminosarum]NEI32636.1 HD domain-containing protein [Rhizobium leguminosarum]NEI39395.1 HD domain-containing protein [Rhizobium leguminosarum]